MQINVNIYKKFKRRMSIMAIITAAFISVSVPLTYFLMSLQDYKMKAKCISEEVSENVVEIIKKDPELWKHSSTKLIQVFDENEIKKISIIRVYDSNEQLIREEKHPNNSIFTCQGEANIIYNNVKLGHVELWISSGYLLHNSIILFLIIIILSSILSFVLFRFPAKIIEQAEMDININTARLNQLSYFDHVTNLRNRTFLSEIFPSLISASNPFTLVFLDLDNFKHINDFYGHSYGDLFLCEVAKRLKELIRSDDIIIHFSGDEFIIIFLSFIDRQNMDKKLKSIIRSFSNPIYLNEMPLFITASIGVTIFPDDGKDLTHLLRNADIAMYTAKRNGRNNY
jgi:diguanylate cyclase (GGDEF)-like protein